MNGFGGHANLLVACAFFLLGVIWFARGESGLGAVFVAVGSVFVVIDQQKKKDSEG